MNTIRTSLFIYLFISFFSSQIASETIEEIIIKGDWRQTSADQEDSSVLVLDEEIIKSQPLKHFEQLSVIGIQKQDLNFKKLSTLKKIR